MLRLGPRQIPGTSNPSVRGRRPCAPEAQQGLEGGHRLPAAIVSKHELVEIDLKLRLADAVIRPGQPLLQIPDGAIRQRHDRGGTPAKRAAGRLFSGDMPDAGRGQSVEALYASV